MLQTAHVMYPLLEFEPTGVPLLAFAAGAVDRPVEALNAPLLIAVTSRNKLR